MTGTGTVTTTNTTTTPVRARASVRTLAVGLGLGAVAAVVANGIVFAVANIGAPVQVATGDDPNVADLALAAVLVASVAWLLIGAAGLWGCEKLFARGFVIWTIGATIITAASLVPLFALDIDTGSKVALAVMHLVVAAAAVAGQAFARRRSA